MSGDPDPEPSDASAATTEGCLRTWRHDVNNALNSALLATHVAGLMWAMDDPHGAAVNLERASDACARLQRLLEAHPTRRTQAEHE